MNVWMKVKKILFVATFCSCLFVSQSAHAFVWPTIDFTKIINIISQVNQKLNTISSKIAEGKLAIKQRNIKGDKLAGITRYSNMLSASFDAIKSSVESSIESTKKAADSIKKTGEQVEQTINDGEEKEKGIANDTVDTVNNQINDGATEEEVNQTIEDAKEESEKNRQKVNEQLDDTAQEISDVLDEASNKLKETIENLPNEILTEERRQEYKEETEKISEKIEELKDKTKEVIEDAKNNYNEQYSTFVASAFEEYSQAVTDYYSGKITKEELIAAGEKFKNSVDSFDAGIDMSKINELIESAQSVASDVEALSNKITNDASNYKEYEDSHLIKNEEIVFAFNYTDTRQNAHLSIVMPDDSEDESLKVMLLSEELYCEKFKIEELETNEKVQDKFRTCVVKAKTEIDYWEELGIEGNPFDYQNNGVYLYKPYQKNGVYKHIEEDYSAANLANVTQEKNYVYSWLGRETGKAKVSEDSTLHELKTKASGGSSSTKDAYIAWGVINVELAKLLSRLRRIDALDRAKLVVKQFGVYTDLFLDARDDDFVDAHNKGLGKVRENSKEDGTQYVTQVFPNMMLHLCSNYVKGMTASEVSLDETKKYDSKATKEAEEKISKCMFVYAEASSRGTIENKMIIEGNGDQGKLQWQENIEKTVTDSAFETLLLSVINNYNSFKDNQKQDETEGSTPATLGIPNLDASFKNNNGNESKVSDFAGAMTENAKVNFYTTLQLLSIADADAQALQTEILLDFPKYDYNYFDQQVNK